MLGPDYIPLLLLTRADRLSPQQDRLPAGQTPRENTMGASDSVVPSGLAPGHRPNRARPRARRATTLTRWNRRIGSATAVALSTAKIGGHRRFSCATASSPPRRQTPASASRAPIAAPCRLMLSDKARPLRRLLLRLQPKLSLPSRYQRSRTMISICSRAVVRSVHLL
jgi:hypothetical protein